MEDKLIIDCGKFTTKDPPKFYFEKDFLFKFLEGVRL